MVRCKLFGPCFFLKYFLPFWYILLVHRTKVNHPQLGHHHPPFFVGRTDRTRKADPTCTKVLHVCTSYRSIWNKSIEQKKVNLPQPGHHHPPQEGHSWQRGARGSCLRLKVGRQRLPQPRTSPGKLSEQFLAGGKHAKQVSLIVRKLAHESRKSPLVVR